MFGRRSQDDCLIGRLCKYEGYGQGVLRNAYGWPPRVLGGHSNTPDSRLGDVHPQNPYRFSLSLLRTGRVSARRLTARTERFGRARIFQIYVRSVHRVKCLILSIMMHNSEHVYKIFGVPGDASFARQAGLCHILPVSPQPPRRRRGQVGVGRRASRGLRGGVSPSPHYLHYTMECEANSIVPFIVPLSPKTGPKGANPR